MKAVYTLDNGQIDEMKLTIAITMTVQEWRAIMNSEAYNYSPLSDLQNIISVALAAVADISSKTYQTDHHGVKMEVNNG